MEHENLLNFKKEMEAYIDEWYTNCPHAMKFTTKVIKSYKKYFGEDYAGSQNNN